MAPPTAQLAILSHSMGHAWPMRGGRNKELGRKENDRIPEAAWCPPSLAFAKFLSVTGVPYQSFSRTSSVSTLVPPLLPGLLGKSGKVPSRPLLLPSFATNGTAPTVTRSSRQREP